MSEEIGHLIIAPDPAWGRVKRFYKLLRMAWRLAKMNPENWYFTIVIKEDEYEDA